MRFLLIPVALMLVGCGTLDRTSGRSDVCALHHTKMHAVVIPVENRMPTKEESQQAATAHRLYPNADDRLIAPFMEDCEKARVYRCDDCVAAKRLALATH